MKIAKWGICLFLLVAFSTTSMAARYWVSVASSNWNNTANWSNVSGGPGGFSVPGASDDVSFDGNGIGSCLIDAVVNVKSITVAALYIGTISQGTNTISTVNAASFSGGIFAGGSGNITFGGGFTLAGTIFTSTSGILEIDNPIAAFTSATFVHNNGTVKLKGGGGQTVSGISPTFYNLEFVGLGNTYTLSSTGNITVVNKLTTSGTLFYNLAGGVIDVKGDINSNNTATGSGGDAMININGTGTQNFNGSTTAGGGALPQITINKLSGTLNLANFPAVSNNFTYTAGTVNAGTSTFCFTHGNIGSYSITGSLTLFNIELYINTSLLTATVAAGTTLTATGDLTLAGIGNLLLNTGTIAVQGNIIDNNTNTMGGGNGTILINGTGTQNLTSTGVIEQGRLPSVTISKSSGTLVLPSLITVKGNWTYTAGTVDVTTNNSTVVFENTMNITGSHTLNNVIFDGSNNYTFTTAVGTVLSVSGNISMTGTGNITLNTGTINLNGNLALTNTGGGGGTTVLTFMGTTSQSITSSLLINQNCLPSVTINKPSGTLVFPALITVRGNWVYTAGVMDVSTNNSTVVLADPLGIGLMSITGTHTLNNVTLEAVSNNTVSVSTGTLLTVTGTLSFVNSSNVMINTPVTGTTAIQAQGNIAVANTGTGGGGTGVILVNGSGAQSITSTVAAGQGWLPNITIQKSAGALTLNGIISESRDWNFASGTVDAVSGSSTVVFGLNNLSVTSAGMNFYHVIFTSATSTLLTSLGVSGNLTINGTGVLAPGGNAVNLLGNWTNRATAGFTEGTSSVNFIGTSLQTITTPNGENFANIVVNNSGPGIRLANNSTVATKMTMTQGNIDLNGNTLTLGLSVANNGTLARTAGTMINTGTFVRWVKASVILSGSVSGLFPMGTATDYQPFYVSASVAPTTGGTMAVSYTDATTNTNVSFADGASTIAVRKDLNWNVVTANGLAGGSYDLQVQGTGLGAIGAVADLRISLANGVVGTAGINGGTTGNPQINRTALPVGNLANTFYVASVNALITPLPLTFVSFTAQGENDRVSLKWETSSEINNDHFTAQRSANGADWLDIKSVKGTNNSGTVSSYAANDEAPLEGVSYYRIQQTDIDGKTSYSVIRSVNRSVSSAMLNVYPNPATSFVSISPATNEPLKITILNSSGQSMTAPRVSNGSSQTFNVAGLAAGIYLIRIEHAHFAETRKVVIRR
ncbi:MAG TPA: T9SS type A sorting domain-containing protein [Puia sp.]|jgi:hypothetical protein